MSLSKKPDTIPNSTVEFVQKLLQPQGLSNIQKTILDLCWEGMTYQAISDKTGYDDSYVRAVGAQLWQSLAEALGQKITKNTFKVVLNQRLLAENDLAASTKPSSEAAIPLPRGPVSLRSPFYIERLPVEPNCYDSLVQPGSLIRIKGPKQIGKTSLMARIIDFGRAQEYATVTLNLELASTDILSNVDRFFRWLCVMVSKALDLPARLDDYWEELCGSSYNCTEYFEGHLLSALEEPIVLALDNADIVFHYPTVAADFFGMLRAWYESARYGDADSDTWKKLRLVVVYSTDVYIPLPFHQSPFNVGMFVELPGFTVDQIATLVKRYQLDWTLQDVEALMRLVGGHPYLVQVTLYHAKQLSLSLADIESDAIAPNSIYSAHLQQQFWALQPHNSLLSGFQQIISATEPQAIDPVALLKLEGLGLVKLDQGRALPAFELYCRYFENLFGQAS